MTQFDALRTALLDLTFELHGAGIELILGGGYGLYLKQIDLQEREARTLIDVALWPKPRATADIDTFIPTEVVASEERWSAIKKAVKRLGYEPVEEARFMRFRKRIAGRAEVGFDLLTGPIDPAVETGHLKIKGDRVRPQAVDGLHARLTPDAIGLVDNLGRIVVKGHRSDGSEDQATVGLPHPFTYLVMKLHAFDDRRDDKGKDLARHHAVDVFRIVAMVTESDYGQVQALRTQYSSDPVLQRAQEIVRSQFSGRKALGVIRVREFDSKLAREWEGHSSSRAGDEDAIDEFIRALRDLVGLT